MDDQKSRGLLSQLIPDDLENALGMTGKEPGEQNNQMAALLKTAAGQAGGGLENEVTDFLNGRGALLETTRTAVARKGSSAANDVADFLTQKMHVAAPVAKLIAPLVVQLFPSIGQIMTGNISNTEKPKPRRRRKTDSNAKPDHSSKPKNPKHESSAKPASSGKPKKPKATSNSKPKKPKSSSSRPSAKRTAGTLETDSTETL